MPVNVRTFGLHPAKMATSLACVSAFLMFGVHNCIFIFDNFFFTCFASILL